MHEASPLLWQCPTTLIFIPCLCPTPVCPRRRWLRATGHHTSSEPVAKDGTDFGATRHAFGSGAIALNGRLVEFETKTGGGRHQQIAVHGTSFHSGNRRGMYSTVNPLGACVYPALCRTRRRQYSSTSSRVVSHGMVGTQPSASRARAASPTTRSTSVGRSRVASTWIRGRIVDRDSNASRTSPMRRGSPEARLSARPGSEVVRSLVGPRRAAA